jgi:hypothetical protein
VAMVEDLDLDLEGYRLTCTLMGRTDGSCALEVCGFLSLFAGCRLFLLVFSIARHCHIRVVYPTVKTV